MIRFSIVFPADRLDGEMNDTAPDFLASTSLSCTTVGARRL